MKSVHSPILAAVALTLLTPLVSHSATIARYQFGTPGSETVAETGPGYAATIIGLNAAATSITDPASTIGLEISSAATTPANAPFLRVDTQGTSTSAAEAVTNNKYFQFTITPSSGFFLNSTSLTFDAARGGGATPRGYAVRSSADGFAANLATADLLTVRPTYTPVSIDLSGPAFQNIPDSTGLTFRFYSFAPAAGQSVDYDNITLEGTIATPEPTSIGLLAFAGSALLGFKRRRH